MHKGFKLNLTEVTYIRLIDDKILIAAKTLIEKKKAKAIIGFGTWQEAVFVAQLCNESKVPILSLANEVPQWASCHWPFLMAAIIQSWKWRKVNIIYEDMNPAVTGISPELIAAIQGVDAEINDLLPLSPFPPYPSLSQKWESVKNESCRVFIVHTSITLATKIFTKANNLGMMDKDYVWITTNTITSQIDSLNASIISSMQARCLRSQELLFHHTKKLQRFPF